MSARARRLEHSLGSSWGEADYASGEGGSCYSGSDDASELELEDSDKEVVQVLATQRPQRKQLRQSVPSAQTPSTPARKPTTGKKTSQSQHFGSDRKIRSQHPFEPSFIMPSMDNSPSGFDRSPAQKPQPRKRTRNTIQDRLEKASGISASSSKQPRVHRHQEPRQQDEVSPWHYVSLFWENAVAPLIGHFLDILSYALRHFIKPVLGVLLGIGILIFSIKAASGLLRFTVSNAVMGPVCAIPGSSYLIAACDAPYSSPHSSPHVDFDQLTDVQSRFEDIIDSAKDSSTLPFTLKHSELAIRDLRILVKHSHLPSRNQLDTEFGYFIETANTASMDLISFNSRIGGAADLLDIRNHWTMNILAGIKEKEASMGSVSRVINQLTSAFIAPPPTLQQRIYDQYILHIGKNKDMITNLIDEAEALLLLLKNLDARLAAIFEIATNDDQTITRNQEELFSFLWTKLGGNRTGVKANAEALTLLSDITAYRKKAVTHVSGTLLKLQQIKADLQNLREGVAAPGVLGHRSELPLEYHIEAIEKGIDRLRASRGEYRRVESETYKRFMHGHGEGDARKELGAGPTVTVRSK